MSLRGFVPDPPWKRRSIRAVSTDAGLPTAGPTRKWHGVSLSRRGRLSLSRVPHVFPRGATRRACCCNLHVNHAMLAPDQIDAMPSQREGQGSSPLSSTEASARQDLLADHGVLWPEV
jgi:hypothetical protein